MLSILPYERSSSTSGGTSGSSSSSQRDSERPFKTYPRVPATLPTSSFYTPFATHHPSFGVGSYFPSSSGFYSHSSLASHSSLSPHSAGMPHVHAHSTNKSPVSDYTPSVSSSPSSSSTQTPGTMDLRPPTHHLDSMPNMMDISQSAQTAHSTVGMGQLRGPSMDLMGVHGPAQIKQEHVSNSHHQMVMTSSNQMPLYQPLMTSQSHGMGGLTSHHHGSISPPHQGHPPATSPPLHPSAQAPPPTQHQQHPEHQPTHTDRLDQQHQQQPYVRTSGSSTGNSDGSPSSQHGSNVHSTNNSDNGETAGFKMPPKKRPLAVPEDLKDNTYWEKRKKNNDSAKRSRDARRMKEEQIAMRVVFLEQENLQLRTEVSLLKSEIEKLRCMLYNS